MLNIKIPYSKEFKNLRISKAKIKGILNSRIEEYKTDLSQDQIVTNALIDPIGSPNLKELVQGLDKVLIITSDHTRPVPSKITLPILLKEIRNANRNVKIKILIATGYHRATTLAEMIDKFSKEIIESEEIINHDCRDRENMVFKGILPSGGELWLNSLVDWADTIVAEGFIEPHFFAGFSGGRKSILPGIAGEKTVLANHCSEFIANVFASTGNLEDNPIHEDMLFAAKTVNLDFILNVVLNGKKEIIKAFAGHFQKAHEKGCEFVKDQVKVKAVSADIVITSNGGYPLDQNIYQAVKGMTAAESCVREGGVIIMVAACVNGHGGEGFYKWFADSVSPECVAHSISSIHRNETLPDQWEAQILARVLMKASVILVTDMCNPELIKGMSMIHSYTIEEAIKKAYDIVGNKAEIVVIPNGVGIIIDSE